MNGGDDNCPPLTPDLRALVNILYPPFTQVTFGSFLLTAMSVIAGLFGMNVTNHMESDYSAFLAICMGSAAAAVTLWLLFVYGSIRYGLMNGLSMTWR